MMPELIDFEARKVVGVGRIGGEHVNPGDVWPIFLQRLGEIGSRSNETETFGIIKLNEKGYLASAEVDSQDEWPEGMTTYVLPQGKYAKMTHTGPVSRIGNTFDQLMGWLETNGHERYDIVCYEVYDHRFRGESEESAFDVYAEVR